MDCSSEEEFDQKLQMFKMSQIRDSVLRKSFFISSVFYTSRVFTNIFKQFLYIHVVLIVVIKRTFKFFLSPADG